MKILPRDLTKSKEYWIRAERIIPAGTQTFSKGPTQFVQGVAPIYLKRGKGSHVFDVDGNEYIDYVMALGPVTLGYSYPVMNKALIKQLEDGITFSLMHPLEVVLSELLVELIPCAEMVRFGKNGSDVTSAAVRVSRAYTGRDKIA
ncbi:aminotransferase class III-fold pyridoxal phosphate-dependent enzyme, partial [bacterium]|nr:aminotransferase class III-fold pyridoxal phosphate-dependent enzyme [bacterium]